MKIGSLVTTLVMVVIALAILTHIHSIVERAYSQANRNAAVSTLNGGESEFAAQQVVKSSGQAIDGIFYLAILGVLAIGGIRIYKVVKNNKEETTGETST
jgi:uncharacterized membrane protein YjgN (DUF898 family)